MTLCVTEPKDVTHKKSQPHGHSDTKEQKINVWKLSLFYKIIMHIFSTSTLLLWFKMLLPNYFNLKSL